jgi:N-acetylmuramoyl-L-alanine amidase
MRFQKSFLKTVSGILLSVALLVASASRGFAEAPLTVKAFEISKRGDVTRFATVLNAEVGYSATVMQDPYRVIIDFADVSFDVPLGAGQKGKGLVRQVRYGILEPGKSRIVVDTNGPVLIKKSQFLPAKGKNKPRIEIELIATTKDALAAVQARDAQLAAGDNTGTLAAMTPAAAGAPNEPAGEVDDLPVVVIDPGHGGIDPGAISKSGVREKDVVLAFAKELKIALETDGKFKVLLTRDADRFMSLSSRVATARRVQADLFVALHADTVRGQSATGATLYTLSDTASDAEAEALAQKENRADEIAGVKLSSQDVQVADVLIDLAQRESKNTANLFAQRTLVALKEVTVMTGKPLRSAGFVVLRSPDVPSMLVELGFLSSKDDEKRLQDKAWRERVAGTFAASVRAHFAAMDAAE